MRCAIGSNNRLKSARHRMVNFIDFLQHATAENSLISQKLSRRFGSQKTASFGNEFTCELPKFAGLNAGGQRRIKRMRTGAIPSWSAGANIPGRTLPRHSATIP